MDDETRYWIGFSIFPGIGPVRFKLLFDYFGSAKEAWRAKRSVLESLHLPSRVVSEFDAFRSSINLDTYIGDLKRKHVGVLTLQNPKYPSRLKEISDAPFVLYVLGKRTDPVLDLDRTIGIVGTRKITPYGTSVTKKLTEQLVSYGFTIVSGLAYGVDTVAHTTAIESGGNTIAVLGCGIDVIAPASNTNLYHEIAGGHGCIMSEMPLGHRPGKGLFPARNRIISGLSLGVVVTEGADDSGALITARNAGEQGRDVFAVPGPITSEYSKGPARLLKQGAVLVEDVEDIIHALGLETQIHSRGGTSSLDFSALTENESIVAKLLAKQSLSIDEIVRETHLTIQVVGSTITILEMKKIIRNMGDSVYSLS